MKEVLFTLQTLKEQTNEAIEILKRKNQDFREPINWADLSCSKVEHIICDDGGVYFKVYVGEVSPSAYEFRQKIYNILSEEFYNDEVIDVEVITEW